MIEYKAPYRTGGLGYEVNRVRQSYHPGGAAVKAVLATPTAQRTQAQLETLWDAQKAEGEYGDRGLAFSHRCEGDEIEGLFVIYGVVNGNGYRYHHGVFKHIGWLRYVHFYQNHDRTYGTLARIKAIWEIDRTDLPSSIRRIYPEAEGGAVVVREYLDTENGQAARAWLKAQRVKGMSFCHNSVKSGTSIDPDGRAVKDVYEAVLHEVSDITDESEPAEPCTLAFTGNSAGTILEGNYQWRRF